MLSICFLLGEVNDFTVAGVAVKLQFVTLKFGSIEGITLIRCARFPFPFSLNAGLDLGQFHQTNHFKTTSEGRKTGIRAVRPKLSALDCSKPTLLASIV